MSMLERLRGRRTAAEASEADQAARLRALELLTEIEQLQAAHPSLSRDPEVRARMSAVVMRGL